MVYRVLSVLAFVMVAFSVQAQNKTPEEKAAQQAEVIAKYINSKFTDASAHLTDDQVSEIKQAYVDYYNDKAAWKARKKEFMTTYKAWKAAVSKPVSAEEKEQLEAQKKEIAAENKAINKESKEMRTRREDKIKAALNDEQQPVFVEMREEQEAQREEDSDK